MLLSISGLSRYSAARLSWTPQLSYLISAAAIAVGVLACRVNGAGRRDGPRVTLVPVVVAVRRDSHARLVQRQRRRAFTPEAGDNMKRGLKKRRKVQ